MNIVRPSLPSSVLYTSGAHKVWEGLKERFDKVNGSRVLFLHREMHNLTQGTMATADYFSKLRDLWDEFDALMPCPGCPCPESKQYAQHFEAQRLLQFLTGLNDSYAQSRSQIMMMTPPVESPRLDLGSYLLHSPTVNSELYASCSQHAYFHVIESVCLPGVSMPAIN
ncbi:uncharacterized protein LOC142162174 [Nicotiana tabacum]|uniref:Uncharacterized protein LOC142162174 n=1 Tax=Nicotiana tabacum TaxID=4097 RepID=A0AC58RPE7_TOBAC